MTDKEAKTAAERQRQWRQGMREKGYRQVALWLDPDVADANNTLTHKELTTLVNRLLREAQC